MRPASAARVFNLVNGRGDTVGAEIATHPDVAKISFTGFHRGRQVDPARPPPRR